METIIFPSEKELTTCLMGTKLVSDPWLVEKGVVAGIANVFAKRELNKMGISNQLMFYFYDHQKELGINSMTTQAISMNFQSALMKCGKCQK